MSDVGSRLFAGAARDRAEAPAVRVSDPLRRCGRVWMEPGVAAATGRTSTGDASFDFADTEIVRPSTPRSARPAEPAVRRSSSRSEQAAGMARYLQVTGAVESGRGMAYRVSPMASGARSDYDLWKGPVSTIKFLLGC